MKIGVESIRTKITVSTLALLMCGGVLGYRCNKHSIQAEKEKELKEQWLEKENQKNNEIMIDLYEEKVSDDSISMVEALKAIHGIDFKKEEKKYQRVLKQQSMLQKNIETNKRTVSAHTEQLSERESDIQKKISDYKSLIDYKSVAEGRDYKESKERLEILKEFNKKYGKEARIDFPAQVIKITSIAQYESLKHQADYYIVNTRYGAYACRDFKRAAAKEGGKVVGWLWLDNK